MRVVPEVFSTSTRVVTSKVAKRQEIHLQRTCDGQREGIFPQKQYLQNEGILDASLSFLALANPRFLGLVREITR
jgi:hypothetical protein